MPPAHPAFQSLPPLPTSKFGPSGADARVGGLCMFQGPVGLANELSCETGSFSHHCNRHRFLQPEVLRLYFPALEPWVAQSVLLPSCSSWFIPMQMWDCLLHQPPPRPLCSTNSHLVWSPLCPGFPSPLLLPICMKVSCLTPQLPDFYTIGFSCNSGYFIFLNLLLPFCWLCEEEKCMYLCLHLVDNTLLYNEDIWHLSGSSSSWTSFDPKAGVSF